MFVKGILCMICKKNMCLLIWIIQNIWQTFLYCLYIIWIFTLSNNYVTATTINYDRNDNTNFYYPISLDYPLTNLSYGDSEYLRWHLDNPINFFSEKYDQLYINTNGIITFNMEFPEYINQPFPLEYPCIAPFYANVDTTITTNETTSITIFNSQDPEQLRHASELIHTAFIDKYDFEATDLIVATWDHVGYYNSKNDKLNTFQAILIVDDEQTFVQFIYPAHGINWLQGDNGPLGLPDIRAQVGFIAEDGRYFNLPGSGSDGVRFLTENSNIGIPGVWLYRVGPLDYESNVEGPNRDNNITELPLEAQSCAEVGHRRCSQYAQCLDRKDGYCCVCLNGYYGNGEICIKNHIPVRVTGSLMGELNGILINEHSKLQSYIVTADGRSYTAITPIDMELGANLRLAVPVITSIGWLFAKPLKHYHNGYQLSGGELLHTAKLSFSTGEILWINQTFEGLNYWDQLSVKVDLHGRVPEVSHHLKLHMAEFIEEYEFITINELHSVQAHNLEVPEENRIINFQLEQRIYIDRCWLDIAMDIIPGTKYLQKVSKIMLDYFKKDEALRSSILTVVGVNASLNVCNDGTANCGLNMVCIPYDDTYRCDCRHGFIMEIDVDGGFSEKCVDIDECTLGTHVCDESADCINNEGGFSCICREGFSGNGYRCFLNGAFIDNIESSTLTLGAAANAAFEENFNTTPTDFHDTPEITPSNDVCHRCSPYADCWEGRCICREGFHGDGYQCNGHCAYDEIWEEGRCIKLPENYPEIEPNCNFLGQCRCDLGYEFTPDSEMCRYTGQSDNKLDDDMVPCDVEFNCHANATCEWHDIELRHICTCNMGFYGNGYHCNLIEDSCAVKPDICHSQATCLYNELMGRSQCQCKRGYDGDGYHCAPAPECFDDMNCGANAYCIHDICQCIAGYERDMDDICVLAGTCGTVLCGANAICKYDRQQDVKYCNCMDGYEGDALVGCKSKPIPCNVQYNCGVHASCEPTEEPSVYECQCNAGYNGDGYVCVEDQNCLNTPQLCDMNAQCLSTNNGLVCVCNKGFYGNGSICLERQQHDDDFLIVSQGVVIVRVPLHGENVKPISVASMAIGLDKDCVEGRIYWGDISAKKIMNTKYDGTDMKTFLNEDIGSPEGIAIDAISRRLYWTDSVKDTIEVASLDNSTLRAILINKHLVNPRGIAVDPYREKLYWSDWNRDNPKIEMSDLDGTGRELLLDKSNVLLPNSLVVLQRSGELCYADAGTKKVECIDTYTKQTRSISNALTYPFGLVYTNNQFYWTDWMTKKVESVDALGQRQKSVQVPFFGSHKMYAMTAIEDNCPQMNSPCIINNGGCMDARLCLVNRKAPSGKNCKCTALSKLCNAAVSYIF